MGVRESKLGNIEDLSVNGDGDIAIKIRLSNSVIKSILLDEFTKTFSDFLTAPAKAGDFLVVEYIPLIEIESLLEVKGWEATRRGGRSWWLKDDVEQHILVEQNPYFGQTRVEYYEKDCWV